MKMLNTIFRPEKFTGWHMALFMCLFFGTIITVNMTMAYYANTTWTGLVVKNSYVASQHFDTETARLKKQQELGWSIAADYVSGTVSLNIADKAGQSVNLAELSAKIGRPVTETDDRQLVLTRAHDGSFVDETELAKGIWQIDLKATDTLGNILERSVRILVK